MEVEIHIFWALPILKGKDDLISTVVLFDAGVAHAPPPMSKYHVMCIIK